MNDCIVVLSPKTNEYADSKLQIAKDRLKDKPSYLHALAVQRYKHDVDELARQAVEHVVAIDGDRDYLDLLWPFNTVFGNEEDWL